MEVKYTPYQTEILTSDYQIIGELHPRGNPTIFINDNQYQALTLYDATLRPLLAGTRLGPVTAAEIHVPKAKVHVLCIREFSAAEAQILPNKIPLITFTDTYVARGNFHTGPETKASDLFFTGASLFYPATEVQVFPVRPLNGEIGLKVEMAYVYRTAVSAYYQEQSS